MSRNDNAATSSVRVPGAQPPPSTTTNATERGGFFRSLRPGLKQNNRGTAGDESSAPSIGVSPTGSSRAEPNSMAVGDPSTGKNFVRGSVPGVTEANVPTPENPLEETTTAGRKLPLWPTMALFASLAANLFFGWIAWDTHSRYQDFVQEMNESEMQRERRTRRLRDEPTTSSVPRRTREQDEADFLRGGIEV